MMRYLIIQCNYLETYDRKYLNSIWSKIVERLYVVLIRSGKHGGFIHNYYNFWLHENAAWRIDSLKYI